MPTKANRLTSIALIFILIIPLFTVLNPTIPEALGIVANPDEAIEFREHAIYSPGAQPWFAFMNSTGGAPASTLWQTTFLSLFRAGDSYVFFVMRASLLNGGSMNIRQSFAQGGTGSYSIFVYDGAYDRESMVDFPDGAALLLKGNGLIQTLNSTAVSFAVRTDTYAFSFSNSLSWVTLMFRLRDVSGGANSAQAIYYNMSIIRGATTLYFTEFNGNIECDLPEENQLRCADNAEPDSRTNSSGYMSLGSEDFDIDPCIPVDFEILNPSAKAEDGTPWVYTETKFYSFNATYINFNLTSDVASIRFSPDGETNVTISYTWLNDINGLLSVVDSADFVTVPSVARNGTGANYNSTTGDLWVIFPIWFTNNSPDAQYVDVYYACTGIDFLDSGEDFHIYNKGGLVERPPPTSNASFTTGGEWFEGCAYYYGLMQANITFRKIQHFRYEFALKAYENSSGTWIPEDQAYQTFQNSNGGAEKYAGVGDWNLRFKVHAWDNASQVWVTLLVVAMWMADGDEGANDEWVSIRSQFQDKNGAFYNQTWNAFLEEEPAARYRTWLDIWINKVNASSLIGARTNAYYFGMNDAGWILYANWNPMIYNSTEAIAFRGMLHNDSSTAYARELDLMKIEVELEVSADSTQTGSGEEFRYCIEDVNINEVKLTDKNVIHEGVNTPIFNAPRVPDMPIGGIIAPLYAAILSIGTIIVDALSGILGIAWDAIATQFPWFTQFIEDMYSLVNAFTQFLTTITTGLVALLDFIAGLFWLFPVITGAIGDTWALITSWLDPFVANAGDWILLAVIVFGIIPFAANVSEGRIKEVRADIETVWGFISTILDWTFRLAKMIIDIILGIIPG